MYQQNQRINQGFDFKVLLTRLALLLLLLSLIFCNTHSPENISLAGSGKHPDTTSAACNSETSENTNSEIDFTTYYILIADTGPDYLSLNKKMFSINSKSNIPIDTMGRYFNKEKNLIALPDDDEDELYAGHYFPRRFPSESLSIEYFRFYEKRAAKQTMALLAGIYELENTADSVLTRLKLIEGKAFKLKASIYTGCIH